LKSQWPFQNWPEVQTALKSTEKKKEGKHREDPCKNQCDSNSGGTSRNLLGCKAPAVLCRFVRKEKRRGVGEKAEVRVVGFHTRAAIHFGRTFASIFKGCAKYQGRAA